MATLLKAESRRLYSWWWDSHISPKNSKWLQENLADMDSKVKAMIRLIEEDADSFARRAEMYYKKRPELMKLVEEFYRAYRALAERYDHATSALQQAHRTMAEAFPNQIPLVITDEPHSGSSAFELEPCTPESASLHTCFNPDEPQKDATEIQSHLSTIKRNGDHTEELDTLSGKNGLKEMNEVFTEERVRKGLNFQEKKGKNSEHKPQNELSDLQKSDVLQKEDIGNKIKHLQVQVSQLSKEKKNLDDQIISELQRAAKAKTEVQSLKNTLYRLNSEKEAAYLQYQQSLEKLSNLEAEMSQTQEEFRKLNYNMLMGVENLNSANKRCLLLEKANQSLQFELDTLKQRHHGLTQQMQAVGPHIDSLQLSLKQLENEKLRLQDICKQCEDEKQNILEKMKGLEKVSDKNVVLENSLSDVHAELEGSREKIKTLEEYCELLCAQISIHISEKALLVSQLEAMSQRMEKLSEKNTFLENSLSDANAEVESLRGKLKGLEESFWSLNDQDSILLAEKNTLLVELGNISQCLKNLEKKHSELQDKYLIVEKEKELTLHQIQEFRESLKLQNQEHEDLIRSNKNQHVTLNSQIQLLREESRLREEDFKIEQLNNMNAQTENFILQKFLCEMKECNSLLSRECGRHLQTLRCMENQKLGLEHDCLVQKHRLTTLSDQNEKLREGMYDVLKVLRTNKEHQLMDGASDEFCLSFALNETRDLLRSLSDVQDENQHLILDRLVLSTLLKQLGLDAADWRLEMDVLERELHARDEELSQIRNEAHVLTEMNEQLTSNVQASKHRFDELNAEMKIVCGQLSDLQENHRILESERLKLLQDYKSLSVNFDILRNAKEKVDEESDMILSEAMTLECLYFIFQRISTEGALELQSSRNELDRLVGIKNSLEREIRILKEKIGVMKVENMHLKEMVVNLDECRNRSMILENDLKAADSVIFTLSEDNIHKDSEVASLQNANEMLKGELDKLQEEVAQFKHREEYLASKLQKGIDEMNCCEFETVRYLDELQVSTINASILEEKLLELILECESHEISGIVERQMLSKAISSQDVNQSELKLKLDALERENKGLMARSCQFMPLVMSLSDSLASLEKYILPSAEDHSSNVQEKQDDASMFCHRDKGNQGSEENSSSMPSEVLELQKLLVRVESLRKAMIDATNNLEQEKCWSNAALEAEKQEHERNNLEISPHHEREAANDAEMAQENEYQIMKDIQLDRVSHSLPYQNDANLGGRNATENTAADDQILETWEAMPKLRDLGDPEIKEVQEKELGIDKLEIPKNVLESNQEWNRRMMERLASDAEKLSVLQKNVEQLKEQMEPSDQIKHHSRFELDAVKAQLKDTEGTIRELIDINNELKKKAEDFPPSFNSPQREQKGDANKMKRQISVSARRESENIKILELELQKIQYVLLKLKEERDDSNRIRTAGKRGVVLRDYIYGKKNNRRAKARFCRCMKPKTDSD